MSIQPRLRKLIAVSAGAVGTLVLAYFLFGWFGFEPLMNWALPKMVADRSGYKLTMTQARFDPLRLSVDIRGLALIEPDGKPLLKLGRLFVDFDAASIFERAYVFEEVLLSEPVAQVELRAKNRLNWFDFIDALAGPTPPPKVTDTDTALPRLLVRHILLEKGRVNFADLRVADGFRTSVDPLQLQLDNLSTLPEDRSDYTLSARTGIGATVRWRGKVGLNPVLATGDVAVSDLDIARLWPYLRETLNTVPPQGTAELNLAYGISYSDHLLNLTLEQVDVGVTKLAISDTGDSSRSVRLDALRLKGGRLDLAKRELAFEDVSVDGGSVAVEIDRHGRPTLLDWLRQGVPSSAPPIAAGPAASAAAAPTGPAAASSPGQAIAQAPAPSPPASGWRLGIRHVGVDRLALSLSDRRFAMPLLARVGQFGMQFTAQGELGGDQTRLAVDGLALRLSDVNAGSGPDPKDWLQLAGLDVQGGHVDLAKHELSIDRVIASRGRVDLLRDAHGELSILRALRRVPNAGVTPAAAAQPEIGWKYRIGKVEAQDFGVAVRDESFKPAASLALEGISASAEGISENLQAELPVRVQFRVKQGGRFEASGKVVPAAPSADLHLKIADLSLLPVQPVLAQNTHLVLASGKANTAGRLRYASGRVSYDGSFGIRQLRVNEVDTEDVIVGWKSMAIPRLQATEDRLRVGQITVDGLQSKLVIFKDKTVNIGHLLRIDPQSQAAKAPAARGKAESSRPFRVDVERVRFSDGEMDFSDLSLALPFSARIHDLKGDVVGLSSKPEAAAQLELDGAVDEFGLARAVGEINLSDPTGYTDIKVVFRNVEMTTLTPYSATFAGRKIESGKLSLDLEYKIKQRQLTGENQVVMDKLKLGERVASPTAMNLPLDLAIAILQDSDGKIDLGLPVSGSLDDPKFSYGQIIWKAIVNIVTKIVTAPFRALGAMMGLSTEQLDKIVFDVGSAHLLPPEKEKLANLSKVMAKRPGLGLDVHGGYAPKADREALKALQLRRDVAQQSGVALAANEEPGPISTAQPATRAALEKLYVQRFGAEALASLQQRYQQANPEPPPASTGGRLVSQFSSMFKAQPPPLSEQEAAKLRGADIHALMVQRLLDAYTVDDARLSDLANERAMAIRGELGTRGIAAERVHIEAAQQHEADGGTVATTLGVTAGTAGAGAATASAPAASAPATPAASAPIAAVSTAASAAAAASAPAR